MGPSPYVLPPTQVGGVPSPFFPGGHHPFNNQLLHQYAMQMPSMQPQNIGGGSGLQQQMHTQSQGMIVAAANPPPPQPTGGPPGSQGGGAYGGGGGQPPPPQQPSQQQLAPTGPAGGGAAGGESTMFLAPRRPNHGMEGRPIVLRANHFQVRIPGGIIQQYEINIVPDKCPRRVNRYRSID